jgi:hypothetical protein
MRDFALYALVGVQVPEMKGGFRRVQTVAAVYDRRSRSDGRHGRQPYGEFGVIQSASSSLAAAARSLCR